MRFLLLMSCPLAAIPAADPLPMPMPSLAGPDTVPEHGLAVVTLQSAPPKAGIVWRVTGPGPVTKATSPRGMLQFSAPPGVYSVECLLITVQPDGTTDVAELRTTVRIGLAKTPPQPSGTADAVHALCQIILGDSGCTATVIYPRRPDGRWDLLTAAHCTGDATTGVARFKDGRKVGVTMVARDKRSDIAWLVTDDVIADLPYAILAREMPSPGVKVWQAGYGTDRPTVRKDGVYVGPATGGQAQFTLSVSHGDSGGAIFSDRTDEVIAAVCCTAEIGRAATMFGGNCVSAWKLRPSGKTSDEWHPIAMPIRN